MAEKYYLKLSDLKVVDEKNKIAEYDYLKPEQGQIHGILIGDIEMGIESLGKPIRPIAAKGTFPGGKKYNITQEDVNAYCAYRPYACAYGPERSRILKLLRDGGTTSEEASPSEQAPSSLRVYKSIDHAKDGIVVSYGPFGVYADLERDVEKEDIVIKNLGEVNPIGTENSPIKDASFLEIFKITQGGRETKDYYIAHQKKRVKTTPAQPEPPSTPTHKVITRTGSRLAFREKPSTQKVSEVAGKDSNKKGKLIEMIPNGSSYILLDEGLGYKGQWDYILYNSKKGYVYSRFTEVISPENHLKYLVKKWQRKSHNSTPFSIDWTTKEINKPYYDRKSAKWCVPIETEYDSTGGVKLKERMLEYRPKGLETILKENNKYSDKESVDVLLSKYISAVSEDYFIDPRPGTKMRVLVTFQEKYLKALPDIIEEENPVQTCNTFSTSRRIVLEYQCYWKYINEAALAFESYARDIDKFDGTVEGADLWKEAERLRQFSDNIGSIVRFNNLSETLLAHIELYLNNEGKTCFISEDSSGEFKKIKKGMDSYIDKEPMDSPRTMNYISFLREIIEMKKGGLEWIGFLDIYTIAPRPKVFPSKKKSTPTPGNTEADKLEKELDKEFGPVKTVEEQLKEKEKIADVTNETTTKMIKEAEDGYDFVGDVLIPNLPQTVRQIQNLDQLFEEVYNKINLGELQSALMACYETPTLTAQFGDVGEVSLAFPAGLPPVTTVKFYDDLPTTHLMKNFSFKLWDAILSTLTSLFINLITDLVNDLFDLCGHPGGQSPNKININKLLSNTPDRSTSALSTDDAKLDILGTLGALPQGLSGFPVEFNYLTPEARQKALTDLSETLSELSLLLEAKELCRLFNGTASDYTIALCRSLIKRKSSSDLSSALNTKTKIADFFILIGDLAGSEMCNTLSSLPNKDRRPLIDCKDPFAPDSDLSDQMKDKGSDDEKATEKQIEEQLRSARKRKKDKLRKIATIQDILAKQEIGDENPFNKLIPDLFCQDKDELKISEGNDDILEKPVLDMSIESEDFLKDIMLDTLFSGAYVAFNEDISSLSESYTKEETVEKEESVKITVKDENENEYEIVNPHLKALEGQGIDIEKIIDEKDTFERKVQVKKPSESAKNILMKLESSNFEAKNDREGIYYEITLPPNRGLSDQFDKVIANLYPDPEKIPKDVQEKLKELKDSIVDWKIRYKIPYQTDASKGSVDDDYIIEIFADDESGEQRDLLRIAGRDEIDTEVESFINHLSNGDTALIKQPLSFSTSDVTIGNISDLYDQMSTESLTYNPYEKTCASCLPPKGSVARNLVDGLKEDPRNSELIGDIINIKDISQRCEAVNSIKYLYDEDNDRYAFIWGNREIQLIYENNCAKKITAYLPPPQAVFGKYVGYLWKTALSQDNMSSSDSSDLNNFIEQIEARYGKDGHSQISRDLVSAVNRQIFKSLMFESKETRIKEDVLQTPYFSLLELENKYLTDDEAKCGTDNHMLNIEYFKNESRNNISSNSCPMKDILNRKTDGSPGTEMSSVELAIIDPVVKMTIRAYLIDYAVRGIFPLSAFKQPEKADGLIVSFFIRKILSEMAEYSKEYVDEFIDFTFDIYNKMVDDEIISPEIYNPVLLEDRKHIGLQGIMRKMIPEVYKDIQDIMRRDTGHDTSMTAKDYLVNSYNNKDNNWIRRVDFMTEQNQTTRLDIVANSPEPAVENYFHGTEDFALQDLSFYKKRAKAKWKDEQAVIIVEKYLKAANGNNDYKGFKESAFKEALGYAGMGGETSSSYQVNFSRKGTGEVFSSQDFKNNINKLNDSLGNISFKNSELEELELLGHLKGLHPIGTYSIKAARKKLETLTQGYIQEDINKTQELLNTPLPVYHEVNFSNNNLFIEEFWKIKRKTDDEIKASLKEDSVGNTEILASIKAFNDFWKKEYPSRNESIYIGYKEIDTYFSKFLDNFFKKVNQSDVYKLEIFFEEVSPNMRIIYSNNVDYSTTALINKYVKENPTLNARLNSLKKHKGAYSEKKIEELRLNRSFIKVEGERFPLPLVDPTRDDNYDSNWWRNYAKTSFTVIKEIKNYWLIGYVAQGQDIKRDLKNSREFKLMFDYLFPVNRYLSFLNVYSFMAISTMDGVEKTFVATKDELYKMFRTLSAGGGSSKGGYKNLVLIKNEHLQKISKGLSGASGSTPCPSFSFSGGFKSFKGLGIESILKLYAKAPALIFKVLVEMIDPNVKAMIKLLGLVRSLGLCIAPPLISLGLLPPTIFGLPPFGIGIGPILTPLGFAYHALGFEQSPPELNKLFGVDKAGKNVNKKALGGDQSLTPQPESLDCKNQDKENKE